MRRTLIVLIASASAACTTAQLGLPRSPVAVDSPDGLAVAYVRNRASLDPPDQSIWLRRDGRAMEVKRLAPDQDWCSRIVWSADSSTVAFLIQDLRLVTVDALSARIVSEQWLGEWNGEYPPHRVAQDLALSADGRHARLRDCAREGSTECQSPKSVRARP